MVRLLCTRNAFVYSSVNRGIFTPWVRYVGYKWVKVLSVDSDIKFFALFLAYASVISSLVQPTVQTLPRIDFSEGGKQGDNSPGAEETVLCWVLPKDRSTVL